MTEQQTQLNRVETNIGKTIKAFFTGRLSGPMRQFRGDELRQFVNDNTNKTVAPASADRVMRSLRRQGVINYRLVSRSQSLYEALPA